MLDHDREAGAYEATRGGEARAEAAADAVPGLIPGRPDRFGRLLALACGTGIVTRRLAAARLPGSVLLADSRRLPFTTARSARSMR